MARQQERLTRALFTCSQWWGSKDDGQALLSLGTTRKLHSEEHRAECLREIEENIAYLEQNLKEACPEIDEVEFIDLERLKNVINDATVGEEWLTDADNMRFNEELCTREGNSDASE